jgi:hypothetical protein
VREMRLLSRQTLTRDERGVRAASRERSDGRLDDDALRLRCIGGVAYAQLAAAGRMTRDEAAVGAGVPFVESSRPGCARGVEEQGVAGEGGVGGGGVGEGGAGQQGTYASPQDADVTAQGGARVRATGAGASASTAAQRQAVAALPPPWPRRP